MTERCPECGGTLLPKSITYHERWLDKLFSFEDIPALVCSQCDAEYLTPEAIQLIEAAERQELEPVKYEQVPVFTWSGRA